MKVFEKILIKKYLNKSWVRMCRESVKEKVSMSDRDISLALKCFLSKYLKRKCISVIWGEKVIFMGFWEILDRKPFLWNFYKRYILMKLFVKRCILMKR